MSSLLICYVESNTKKTFKWEDVSKEMIVADPVCREIRCASGLPTTSAVSDLSPAHCQ